MAGTLRMTYGVSRQTAAQAGSWSYDRDTLTDIAKEWRDLETECEGAERHSEVFTRVCPPGNEYVSETAVNKINSSNSDYLRMLGEMRVYAGEQADACDKALGVYEDSEDERTSFFSDLFASIENEQRSSGGLL